MTIVSGSSANIEAEFATMRGVSNGVDGDTGGGLEMSSAASSTLLS